MRAATVPSTACTELSKGSVTGAAGPTVGGAVVTAPGVVAGDPGDAFDAFAFDPGDTVEGAVGEVTLATLGARPDARAGMLLRATVVNGDAATAVAEAAWCRVVEAVPVAALVAALVVVTGPDAARPADGATVVPHPAVHATSIATAIARADRTGTNLPATERRDRDMRRTGLHMSGHGLRSTSDLHWFSLGLS